MADFFHDDRLNVQMNMTSIVCREGAPVGFLLDHMSSLPEGTSLAVRSLLKSAEFRSINTLLSQMVFLRSQTDITVRGLASLFDMPSSSVQDLLTRAKMVNESPRATPWERTGPNGVLLVREEEDVLRFIEERQMACNCASIQDVCCRATQLLRQRVHDAPSLSTTWWKSFKNRHKEQIVANRIDPIEAARTTVSCQDVKSYFERVQTALLSMRSLQQLVNMDESGFTSRADKGRKKKCVYSLNVPTAPRVCEEENISQVTVVSAMNLAGECLKPMFITIEQIKFNIIELEMIRKDIVCVQSSKGYQSEKTMAFWVKNVFGRYCKHVRDNLQDPNATIWIIMDNCSSHNTDLVQREFSEIGNIEVIWLPPHSSHFLQQLDACYFGIMKTYYRSGKTEATRPKVTGKVLRAFKAVWNASNPINVMRCWQLTGFRYSNLWTDGMAVSIDEKIVDELMAANCIRNEPKEAIES